MRTTIELLDSFLRQMTAAVACRFSTIKDSATDAMRQALGEPASNHRYEVDLPLIRSDKPGTLKITNADIEELFS